MLDDLKLIHERDPQDALGIAEKQWEYLLHKFEVSYEPQDDIANVVLAGMGGSALPAVYLNSWPKVSAPFEIVRDYSLPEYVDGRTLFIASSYSGNTEETLSALADAEARGAQIVIITAGGKLAEQAELKNYPLFRIPSHIQPRMATYYFLAGFIQLLEPLELVEGGSLVELQAAGNWLKNQSSGWRPDSPTSQNIAKQHALDIVGKTLIAYGGPRMWPAVNKWKITHNENAKNLAWSNQYSEFNHNEFIGWTSHPVDKPFAVVEIRSNLEHERVKKRFEVSERLLSGKRPAPIVVNPEGETVLKQLLWASMLGDFVSLYVAILNNVNPTPVDLVEKLKKELA